jgi:hypothetical protein
MTLMFWLILPNKIFQDLKNYVLSLYEYFSMNICSFISLWIFPLLISKLLINFFSKLLINFNLITNIFLDCKPVKEQFHKLFNIFRHKKCHSFEIIFFIKFRVVIQNEDIYEIYYITNRFFLYFFPGSVFIIVILSFVFLWKFGVENPFFS